MAGSYESIVSWSRVRRPGLTRRLVSMVALVRGRVRIDRRQGLSRRLRRRIVRVTTPAIAPPTTTSLVLVRHAVTAQTGPLLSGRAPGIDLSEDGEKQARDLGERMAALPIDVIYASPIERTTQTARAIAAPHALEVQCLDGVLEADYGEWTGQKISDLAKTDLWKVVQRSPSRAVFPGGEAMSMMQTRMVAAIEAVVAEHPGQLVVVVSHADPIKAAIAHYTGVHLDLFQRIVVSPASVTAFAFTAHGVAMLKCNDTGGLDELVPPKPAEGTSDDASEGAAESTIETASEEQSNA
jgi:probable phosphomutase (TIGR03848 family)